MGKTARLKKASGGMVLAPRDRDEANGFLERLGAACRERLLIEAALDREVAALREAAEREAVPLGLEVEQLTKGLQMWAEANRLALTRNGASKTVLLPAGRLAWRLRPASVRITGVDAVIETLTKLDLGRFLRSKVEIDKEAMLRAPALASTVAGVKIGTEGEDFVVEPASVALVDAPASVGAVA